LVEGLGRSDHLLQPGDRTILDAVERYIKPFAEATE
jgi:hypothetical protein